MKTRLKKSILIIEDSLDLQYLLKEVIEAEGYQALCAANGKDAIDLLQVTPVIPSLILLDLMMPIMDGFEFRKLQLQDPKWAPIPVVVMTADSNPESKVGSLGAADVAKKPLSLDRVTGILKKFVI